MSRALPYACLLLICYSLLNAQSADLSIEHSVKVEFPTQVGYDYTVYSTTDPNQQSGWKPLGLISHATGEKATFFYQTSPDQKVFFKVEGEPSTGVPAAAETSSIIPIMSLPPGTIPGLYDLGDALGESPTGGAYRMIVPPGTFDYVILLPHPSETDYHGLQLKLSLFQGGTGLGSGRVILKVPTTDGSSYEPLKMVDNGGQSIVEEVVIMDATGSTQPRKVVIDLFNDSRSSDATGGQWIINTPSEGGGNAIGHQWEGTQLALKKEDGSWGDFVDLRGAQGERGLKGDKGDQGNPGLKGDKGDRGDPGLKGDKGNPGRQGDKGDRGDPGLKGDKGDQGERGPAGNITFNNQDMWFSGNLNGEVIIESENTVFPSDFDLSSEYWPDRVSLHCLSVCVFNESDSYQLSARWRNNGGSTVNTISFYRNGDLSNPLKVYKMVSSYEWASLYSIPIGLNYIVLVHESSDFQKDYYLADLRRPVTEIKLLDMPTIPIHGVVDYLNTNCSNCEFSGVEIRGFNKFTYARAGIWDNSIYFSILEMR